MTSSAGLGGGRSPPGASVMVHGNDGAYEPKFTHFGYIPITMRPSQSLDSKRDAVRAAAARYRTTYPRVFGSVVRGAEVDGSDLDLLVDALPGTTLCYLGGFRLSWRLCWACLLIWSR